MTPSAVGSNGSVTSVLGAMPVPLLYHCPFSIVTYLELVPE